MRYAKLVITFFLPVVALFAIGSCAHDRPVQTDPETLKKAQSEPVAEEVIPETPHVDGTAIPAGVALADPVASETLSDGKILEVAHEANAAEIAQAQLVEQRATDARVRRYAEEMVRMHKEADQRGDKLASETGLQPAASSTSNAVRTNAAKTFDALSAERGIALDRAYVAAQIEEHTEVLRLLDNQLIPGATDENVKALVSGVRPMVARHLRQAMELSTQLKDK